MLLKVALGYFQIPLQQVKQPLAISPQILAKSPELRVTSGRIWKGHGCLLGPSLKGPIFCDP